MSYREDIHKSLKETFGYDELERLNRIAYYVNGTHQVYLDRLIMYDESGIGNISSITGVGSEFNYGENDAGPHALTSVSRTEPGWRSGPQEIKYTAFNKVSSVVDTAATGKTLSYSIYYGMNDQRRKSVYKDSGQVIRTKHYFGDYEKINENSTIKNYHYISSPTGLCAIFVTEGAGTQGQVWHAYTDHLGSLIYMVNADNSNDYKEYSFDAWGNPRNAADWTDTISIPLFGGRGFTGHEHLEEFGLINMNGRIYDPMLGRFFSPDPYVQLPWYAGSYNRYSYCLNNPLIYTDPDGEFIFTALAVLTGQLWALPITIGTDIGAVTGGIRGAQDPDVGFWKGAGRGAIVGGVGGALSMVGGGTFVANIAWGMGEGAIAGGLDAVLWGNDVGEAMLWGAAIGGAFAVGQSTFESYKNFKDGYGFGTNVGRFNHYVEGVQEAFNNNNMTDVQKNLNLLNKLSASRFGTNPNVQFMASGSSKSVPNGNLGVSFFEKDQAGNYISRTGRSIRRSYIHESAHISNIRYKLVPDASGNKLIREPYFFQGDKLLMPNSMGQLINHGTVGYYDAIRVAGKYHLKIVESLYPGTRIAWDSYGFMKYLYSIPLRF